MKVKRLQLQNYGRFEDLTIDFAPTAEKNGNVTLIVGNNGAGKSQILQALATGLSWFVGSLKTGETIGFKIDLNLIKNDKTEASVKVVTNHQKDNKSQFSSVQWQLSNVRDGRVQQLDNNFSQLNGLVKEYRNNLTHIENFSLPLLVLYPVERAILQYVEADILSHGYDQLKGYYESLNGSSIDFSDFLSWFRNAEDIENEIKLKDLVNDKEDLRSKVLYLTREMSSLNERLSQTLDRKEFEDIQKNYRKYMVEIEELQEMLENKIERLEPQLRRLLGPIRESIARLTGFTNVKIRRQGTPTMIVEKDGEELDVNQLSQGEKSLLALVGDIARRLALLNPSLDNPLEGEGVVMIDEVDMHLHPKWQHDLIDNLVKTFPNVQFILTTHSPHVISDRNDILLYSLEDGELIEMPNVYGEDVNTVLTKIFDVDIRDSKVEKQFTIIRRAISNHDYDEADKKIDELAKQLPLDNLELLKCRLMLAQAKLTDNKNTNKTDYAKN